MQIRNPVHHHIMLISTSPTLIRKKIHPYCTNTLHTPIHQDLSTEKTSARGPGPTLMVVLDQHHTLREETLLLGQSTVPAGRKQPHFSGRVKSSTCEKNRRNKMGDSDRNGQDKLFKRLPAPLDFPLRCATKEIHRHWIHRHQMSMPRFPRRQTVSADGHVG